MIPPDRIKLVGFSFSNIATSEILDPWSRLCALLASSLTSGAFINFLKKGLLLKLDEGAMSETFMYIV